MEKKYREIEFLCGWNIERAVIELLEYKEKGELVCGEFNGHMLYSDTVTMDGAYLEITGKNKNDFDKAQEEWREKLRIESELAEKAARENIPNWIEKGHKAFAEDKWEEWDKIVPIRAEDLYQGMELKCCLDIVEILNKGTLEEAKREIESQGHSGMSFGLVCSMVKEFSPKGEEFVNYIR